MTSPDYKQIAGGIGMGYLKMNYSPLFYKNCRITGVRKKKGSTYAYVVSFFRDGGDCFAIHVNLKNNTIFHMGPYSKNKGFPAKSIIEFNKKKYTYKTGQN